MNDLYKDTGFILLCLLVVMLFAWALGGCASSMKCGSCPSEGHGACPFNPTNCCNGHKHD
jgi:hypothetical protein